MYIVHFLQKRATKSLCGIPNHLLATMDDTSPSDTFSSEESIEYYVSEHNRRNDPPLHEGCPDCLNHPNYPLMMLTVQL